MARYPRTASGRSAMVAAQCHRNLSQRRIQYDCLSFRHRGQAPGRWSVGRYRRSPGPYSLDSARSRDQPASAVVAPHVRHHLSGCGSGSPRNICCRHRRRECSRAALEDHARAPDIDFRRSTSTACLATPLPVSERVVFQTLLFLQQYAADLSQATDLRLDSRAFVGEQTGTVGAVDVAGAKPVEH